MKTVKHILIAFILVIATSQLFSQVFSEMSTISLTGVNSSSVAWGDYDNDGDLDILLAGTTQGFEVLSKIYRNEGSNTFVEQTHIALTGVSESTAAWGDYDNDGDLDILLTGYAIDGYISKIYRNTGNNSFSEESSISLSSGPGSAAWGDYDNDGDLDILICGAKNNIAFSKIYRNNGKNSFTEQTNILLTGVSSGSIAWGDYDNDGNLDVLLTGQASSSYVSIIYKNNGNNTFTEQTAISLKGVYESSAAWGDYDNDGDLDILLTGVTGAISHSKLYRNDGNNIFTEQTGIILSPAGNGSVAWGDYDNDGDLDILITGETFYGGSKFSKIYCNEGDNTFAEETGISLTGVWNSSVAWGDYDNDGDLDILLTGVDSEVKRISKIYRNNSTKSNTKPTAPLNLQSVINQDTVIFSWNRCTDAETSQSGLSYNISIGKKTRDIDIKSPMSAVDNGYRMIPSIGNAQLNNFYSCVLPPGKYYWRAQAIDHALEGSNWSEENIAEIKPPAPVLLYPVKDSIVIIESIRLIWNPVDEAEKYILQVSASPVFESFLLNDSNILITDYTINGLEPASQYYWRVYSYAGGAIENSETWSFKTTSVEPTVPVLSGPLKDSIINCLPVNLSWNASINAVNYNLQVSLSPDFNALVVDRNYDIPTVAAIDSLEHTKTYYWHVRAANIAGTSDWSETWNLTYILPIPATPSLNSPENNSTLNSLPVTFTWDPTDNAANYNLQISETPDFNILFEERKGIINPPTQMNGLEHNKTYYWRVCAANIAGTSDWSETWNYTYIVLAPKTPLLKSPSNGAIDQSVNLTLDWYESGGAENYVLQISEASDFNSVYIEEDSISSTSKKISGLADYTTYFWRVKAVNEAGASDWSTLWKFTTRSRAEGNWLGKTQDNYDIYFHVNSKYEIDTIYVEIEIDFGSAACLYTFICPSLPVIGERYFQAQIVNPLVFRCKDGDGENDYPVITGTFTDDTHCSGTISSFKQCGGICGENFIVGSERTVSEMTWYATGEIYFAGIPKESEYTNSMKYYPNPTNGVLYFEVNSNEMIEISILSIEGNYLKSKIFEHGTGKMDLSDLQNGIYLLRMSGSKGIYTGKVIKH